MVWPCPWHALPYWHKKVHLLGQHLLFAYWRMPFLLVRLTANALWLVHHLARIRTILYLLARFSVQLENSCPLIILYFLVLLGQPKRVTEAKDSNTLSRWYPRHPRRRNGHMATRQVIAEVAAAPSRRSANNFQDNMARRPPILGLRQIGILESTPYPP